MLSLVKHILVTVLIIALLWVGGLVVFAINIPGNNVVALTEAAPVKTDAIVVLTGGAQRLEKGFQLLIDHKAPILFISGVEEGVTLAQILKQKEVANLAELVPQERVELGHVARSTFQNAEETSAWVRQQNIKSIRLVTANYHMPRSLLEMHKAMPDVRIIAEPVFPAEFADGQWFLSENSLLLVLSEYHKFIITYAAHKIGILNEE